MAAQRSLGTSEALSLWDESHREEAFLNCLRELWQPRGHADPSITQKAGTCPLPKSSFSHTVFPLSRLHDVAAF